MEYGRSIRLRSPFAETAEHVRRSLKDQGFGVLTEIDVKATMAQSSARTWRTT